MASFTNLTFDEIEIGQSESITRLVSAADIEALALVSGDVDPFHLEQGEGDQAKAGIRAKAVGAEALVSGILCRRLPGPGTTVLSQQLQFSGEVFPGDELTGTVEAIEKFADGHEIVFNCGVTREDQKLVSGTVRVAAPTARISYSNVATPQIILRRNDTFAKLLKQCQGLPPAACAIVHPCDRDSLLGPIEAYKQGLIEPVLVGPENKIRAAAEAADVDLAPFRIESTEHSHAAAERAVEMARSGEVESLMKGSLHTDELLAAVVSPSRGLRTARRMSHVFLLDVPSYPKPLFITDAAINIYPGLEVKVDIVQNAIGLAHDLGIEQPKVAILSAVETINPKIPSTVEAATLCKMADRGQITGGLLDGPLAFDNAINLEAAKTKKIVSEVAGLADILVAPDLEAGNMIAKQLQYLAGADSAGIVLGTRVPIVLTSRADTVRTRLASVAVMTLVAKARHKAAL
ncbi:MAG: bifunctional enoyl-CoA hydratase/phosphate acetyltransferase [Gammaproteobacteria bacterium]|nr:bifunctional enoyl-CoA hydratase/phosphate acetyltransferase [Gammaproteobacteria bacterium]